MNTKGRGIVISRNAPFSPNSARRDAPKAIAARIALLMNSRCIANCPSAKNRRIKPLSKTMRIRFKKNAGWTLSIHPARFKLFLFQLSAKANRSEAKRKDTGDRSEGRRLGNDTDGTSARETDVINRHELAGCVSVCCKRQRCDRRAIQEADICSGIFAIARSEMTVSYTHLTLPTKA